MVLFANQLDFILPSLHAIIFAFIFFRVTLSKPSSVAKRTRHTHIVGKQLKVFVPKLKPRTITSVLDAVLPSIYKENVNYFDHFRYELARCHLWSNFLWNVPYNRKFDFVNFSAWLCMSLLINIYLLFIEGKFVGVFNVCADENCDRYEYVSAVYLLLIITVVVNAIQKIHNHLFSHFEFYYDYLQDILPDESSLLQAYRTSNGQFHKQLKPRSHVMKTSTIYVQQFNDERELEEMKYHNDDEDVECQAVDVLHMDDELELVQTRKITLYRAIRFYILQKTIDFVPIRNEVTLFLLSQYVPAKYEQLSASDPKSAAQLNKTVIEKYTTNSGVGKSLQAIRWRQVPVEFDGSYHWINYAKQFYKYAEYSVYRIGGSPKNVYSFLTFARMIYPTLINRQLLSIRLRTKLLHNSLLKDIPPFFVPHQLSLSNYRSGKNHQEEIRNIIPFPRRINKYLEQEHDIWLLENFFIEWFDGYTRELLRYIFQQHDQERRLKENWDFFFTNTFRFLQIHASDNNYQNIVVYRNRYFYFVLIIMLYLTALIAATVFTSCLLETKHVLFVLFLQLCNYFVYVGIVSSYFIFLWKLIFPLMVKDEFKRLYFVLSKRFPRIMKRNTRYLNNIHGLLQHFHPVCRLARVFPQYAMSRWLITIQDDDLPTASLSSKKSPYTMESLETGSVLLRDNLLVLGYNVRVFLNYYITRIRHYGALLGKAFFHILLIIGGDVLREIFIEGIVIFLFYSVAILICQLMDNKNLVNNVTFLILIIFFIMYSVLYGLQLLSVCGPPSSNSIRKRVSKKRHTNV